MNKELIAQRIDSNSHKAISPWQRVSLIAAALWMQVMVVLFVVVQVKRSVPTPVKDWVSKISYLLGM